MSDNSNPVVTLSDNPDFIPNTSTNEIFVGNDMTVCLTDVLYEKADIDHTHSEYALTSHTHDGYVSQGDLDLLEDVVYDKADATHTHSEYASSSHTHLDYATVIALDALGEEVDGKASVNHAHIEYASSSHEHDGYAAVGHTHTASEVGAATSGHNHDNDYADINHNHSDEYAAVGHNHNENYASIDHDHNEYATVTALEEVSAVVSNKASASHSHNDAYYTETEVDAKLATKADSTHSHTGVYDASGAAANALTSANAYTDSKIDALVGTGASTTLDTIGEISSAIEDNQDAIDLLNSAIGSKANASVLASHTGNTTIHVTETEKNDWNVAKTHADTAHAPVNAEANQNAFSNIVVGSTTISADTETDTITFIAGSNVTLTPNADGDSITIAATNTVYAHPTSAGNKHIPAGGSSGQILRWSSDGTAVWGADNNTTYSVATQTTSGLMSDTDKVKLDGIAENANNYTLPSAGSSLGGVKTGGDVTISAGVITVNDDSHNHIISNIDGLQYVLDGKAESGHTHGDVYYTETEIDNMVTTLESSISGKANTSHTHTIANVTSLQASLDAKVPTSRTVNGKALTTNITLSASDVGADASGSASAALASAKSYANSIKNELLNGAGTAYDTLKELGDLIDDNTDAISALETIASGKANATHTHAISDITSLQAALDGKAASSHGTHVTYSTTAPKANGAASVGAATTVSRSDHVHPLQTTVSGNAGTATKLATARTISLTGDVTGSVSFDGSANASITATVADDSHNHVISNVDGLQTALDSKSATSHNHNSAYVSKSLQFTGDNGGVIISINKDDGKNILTEIGNLPIGFYTVYSQSGTAGNPKTTEAWRFMVHKTSASTGWVQGYGSIGSVYTNYQDGATTGWRGWKCIWDNDPDPLWSGAMYMSSPNSSPQTVTPSKKLSECRTGWLLLWSDYDPGVGANDADFATTIIPKNNPSGGKWGGKSFLCDIPRYVGSNTDDVDTERRIIKPIYVHDDRIEGSYQNDKDERNDVVLRAVFEI